MNKQIRRILLTAALALTGAQAVLAQDERDALRFSFLQPQGTARSIGFGSALGSIGGDFSSLSVNPAGIGIYRRSEFTISPSLKFSGTESSYTGNAGDENGSRFAISNVGLVSTRVEGSRERQRSGWSTVSFGIGMTRLADFTRDYAYQGRNTSSSGSFVFEYDANEFGISPNDVISAPGDLGYYSYLLDTFGTGLISVVNPTDTTPVSQSTMVRERGGISEIGLTLGGNYEEKLMLGATLGIPIVRYNRTKTFEERDLSGNNNNDFEYFNYSDELKISGAGVNLKLGFIYKPTDNFRFGAAVHTPTYYSLSDFSNRSLTANTERFAGLHTATALENQYDYNLTTPWRGIISASALFGPVGFFTIDYEYVDYKSARFSLSESYDDQVYQREINNTIKSTFRGASNIRAGAEFRLDNFMLRGGFGYYGNPYKSGNPDAQRLDFSGGLGFRFENAFIDLGYVHSRYKDRDQPYSLPDQIPYKGLIVPTAQLNTGTDNVVLTLGFKM